MVRTCLADRPWVWRHSHPREQLFVTKGRQKPTQACPRYRQNCRVIAETVIVCSVEFLVHKRHKTFLPAFGFLRFTGGVGGQARLSTNGSACWSDVCASEPSDLDPPSTGPLDAKSQNSLRLTSASRLQEPATPGSLHVIKPGRAQQISSRP